ncbi:DHHA1 domain-containing protein [Haloparvum alkalitolerans]|uniref:DHH family phosphoesterase n=1 Tax=Haloparvum alkalitolerans TaxID=1042953 RepID=UPI003CF21521
MVRRLVLGCGSVGHTLVERARERRGELHVVATDTGWVTTLREANVAAVEADPTDSANYPDRAAVVVVASDDPDRNLAAALSARAAFPDALIVAYAGENPADAVRDRLRETADRLIDPVDALADRVVAAAGADEGERLASLFAALRKLNGPLAVVTHDNPDPDAIASAIALVRVAEAVGVPAEACYHGEISHQENRALVNLLDIPIRNVESINPDEYGGIALVDHSRAGVNDSLDPETPVAVVVDHHPPRGPVDGAYVDIRPDLGATSTILAEYLDRLGIEPDRRTATALLYGIRVDTRDLTREVSAADFEAGANLLPFVDEEVLERVESPSVSANTVETLAEAIRNRDVRGSAVASCAGPINDRDALAQAAERLLNLEDVTVSLVYGYMDGVVYVSARARGASIDLGETLREALDQIGSAGGHADMAGAQVPLGILGEVDEEAEETLTDVVEDIVSGRFFETLADAPAAPDHDPDAAFPHD